MLPLRLDNKRVLSRECVNKAQVWLRKKWHNYPTVSVSRKQVVSKMLLMTMKGFFVKEYTVKPASGLSVNTPQTPAVDLLRC